jgi:chromosome segregation protein
MKIKRLEISGFKSFADKVVLDFQQGVTGIVGPNGCGKSNLVDAIRWCMGEQSVKNLRGKAMEDIIFAGSESRKPLGIAEVSLVFSTEDGRAPAKYLEFSEIQLTRRLFRDGESEYLINKTPCRLMDITELFMDTGVGTRAYSIIEQGKIGMILHSRPEERRVLIEEAAGVTKFKARKQLALKKIEATRQNLSRLNDLIGEIRRQLNALQRQAKKAEKFRECREELRGIELQFIVRNFAALQQERSTTEQELTALNERIRAVFAAASGSEAQAEQRRIELVESEKKLGDAQESLYSIRNEASACENGLVFRRKEHDSLGERISRLGIELESLVLSMGQAEDELATLVKQQQGSSVDSSSAEQRLQEMQSGLDEQEQVFEKISLELEGKRRDLFTSLGEAAQHRTRGEGAHKRLVALMERMERQGREQQQMADRLGETRKKADELKAGFAQEQKLKAVAEETVRTLAAREQDIRQRLPEIDKACQAGREELNRAASRLHSLRELEAQFAGYGQGVRSLLKDSPLKERFGGLVADSMDVPEEYEAAIEAALADRLQGVICSASADAVEALEYLRSKSAGRAHLAMPLKEMGANGQIKGAIPLYSLITVADKSKGLIQRALSTIYLAADLKQAISLAADYPELGFVTRDGDMVSLGGLITGGSTEVVSQGIIHKKREIKLLVDKVAQLEKEVADVEAQRERLRQESHHVAQELLVERSGLHQLELSQTSLQKDLQQAESEAGRIEERLKVFVMEQANLSEEHGALDEELRSANEMQTRSEQAAKQLETETAALKCSQDEQREGLVKAREALTILRVEAATLKEQREALQRTIQATRNRIAELKARIESGRTEQQAGTEQIGKLEAEIRSEEAALKQHNQQQVAADAGLAKLREQYEQVGQRLAEAELLAKKGREESEAVRQQQSDQTLKFTSLAMQLEHLEQTVQDRYRISLATAQEQFGNQQLDESAAKRRQQELESQLEELGEVNLMAIDEYAGMETRYNFLSAQKADLEESLQDLQQAIQRINRTTRQRFLETFNQVNGKFQEVFPRLFCGGRAELKLTDEQDLLETGIEIIVQPPGKKLANVMMMSGGEKALTAVALIFSIFLVKPTPFCLLDEVDAPLDDANIGRFNEMVREMSAISQFLLITHNKTTMGVADTLYGVTMEEPGASRIVSVRLH